MVHVLVNQLLELTLTGTALANDSATTIGRKLLKLSAVVKLNVRCVKIAMASGCWY